jgi:pyruvate dehydrogenase E2 component (dihydrolipoamide acetyltransferase)
VAIEFKLPELGENISAGDVVRVAVAVGDTVAEGQTVLELETDKAVIEVPSSVSGKVSEVRVKQGDNVAVGTVVLLVESGAAAAKSAEVKPAAAAPEPAKPAPVAEAPVPLVPPLPAAPVERKPAEIEFKVPELGENIAGGDVVRIVIHSGQEIKDGDPVVELETDKAVIEVPSTVSGTVKKIFAQLGKRVKVGDVLFTVSSDAEAEQPGAAAPAGEESYHSSSSMAREAYRSARKVEGRGEAEAFPPDAAPVHPVETVPVNLDKDAGMETRPPAPASPIVRRLARELGVDIYEVKGSGPGGRISDADVRAHAKALITSKAASAAAPAIVAGARTEPVLPDFSRWGEIEVVPIRGVRRKTAEHLAESWNVIPHVTQFDKADVTELELLRKRFAPKAEAAGGKMTMTAIALKVVASALKVYPQFNASIDMARQEIIYKRYINIGLAVDTDRGLLVPVIRDVDNKNIVELAVELSEISKKARDKKLTPEDMSGGTFTITNLGGIGGTAFTPIVNHPEVAILGISRGRIEPVWVKDKFEPRQMLPLSLSYDHRIIDGADAARFTRWVVEALEQPFLLSVQG